MDDDNTIEALTERVAVLEALVERLATVDTTPVVEPATTTSPAAPTEPTSTSSGPLPRRQLIGRAGTAAIGVVLGSTVAAVAAASPAAAATGSFDTNDGTPALTATTTGTNQPGVTAGPAIKATSSGGGAAISATATQASSTALIATASDAATYALQQAEGRAVFDGEMTLDRDLYDGTSGSALYIKARGPNAGGIALSSDGYGALFKAYKLGLWVLGGTIGVQASGDTAQVRLANDPTRKVMPPPRTRSDAHLNGELYFDDNNDLWVCVADGTPGSWEQLNAPPPDPVHGLFTVLPAPTRVFDTRPASGYPGAGLGPITGDHTGIDLTANATGVPTDATAAVVMITVLDTNARANAYCKLYADDITTAPLASAIRWETAGSLIATTTTTRLTNAKARLKLLGRANVLLDVVGYYR